MLHRRPLFKEPLDALHHRASKQRPRAARLAVIESGTPLPQEAG